MAIIKKYKSEITSIENPVPDIYVVTFKSVEKPYKYLPGQFLHLALEEYDPSMPWPESRCFSIQSGVNSELLKITFAVKGKFTKRMAGELGIGKKICLKLPYGELFSKEHDKDNSVFIAGGTGITPFLSLFNSDIFCNYKNPKLYLGLKDRGYNLYSGYLDRAKTINDTFFINILHENESGILDIAKIYEETGKDATYFISGPPLMIKNFKKHLIEQKVDEVNIRIDDWE